MTGECPICGGEMDHAPTCEVGVLTRERDAALAAASPHGLDDTEVEAVWRAEHEAERVVMQERGEDDPGPYDELDWPAESEGNTREQAAFVTRAGFAALAAARSQPQEATSDCCGASTSRESWLICHECCCQCNAAARSHDGQEGAREAEPTPDEGEVPCERCGHASRFHTRVGNERCTLECFCEGFVPPPKQRTAYDGYPDYTAARVPRPGPGEDERP